MPRGRGFVHLNTPASIAYSPGQRISLSDLREKRSREECVVLPHTMGIWRLAFLHYTKMEGLVKFARDIEAEREDMGQILPPLRAPPPVKQVDSAATETVAPRAGGAVRGKGIEIVSHHKLSGERRFLYPDYDGVLSAGIVPEVVVSEDEKVEREMNKKYYITPVDMTEDERAAFEELESMWKSYSRSRSEHGSKHRAAAGTVVPTGAVADDPDNVSAVAAGRAARRRLESNAVKLIHDEERANGTTDVLDDALRLVDELLEFT
ncbi:hypothetical protein ERJ75_000029300 [Trypanosoma vivax]|nr:hypothetical protein TRVL_00314 [Trypanosoma vivax]KAH8620780.1 hypothetical protein ERJ75_000029300 [Trypanosoma vivax]